MTALGSLLLVEDSDADPRASRPARVLHMPGARREAVAT